MKRIGIVLATLALAASAFGQGQIIFQNRVVNAGLFAPIYGVNPADPTHQLIGNSSTNGGAVNYGTSPLLIGTGWTAGLYGDASATDPNSFQLLATAQFNTSATLMGIIRGPTQAPTVPWVPGPNNGVGNFEIRVWDNRNGAITTWAMVLADPTIARGRSATMQNVPVIAAPNSPVTLPLTSFGLMVVPEPSLIALGALGLGALLLRRRKA